MFLSALKDTFTKTIAGRAAGAAMLGAVALTVVPGPANDAFAQSNGQIATAPGARGLDGVQGMDDMAAFSKKPDIRGIGAFINLEAHAPVTGDQVGEWLQGQFAGVNPPVRLEYRVNQSRGSATDITFYVRGFDFKLNVGELETRLHEILAHHRDVWLPETLASNAATPTRQ